jgi:aryl-alcohol dehydrogenase-like predicted oxidoreductase
MKYGAVPGVNKPIARLAQGTTMLSSTRLEQAMALLDGVFDLGGNTFDTGHAYGSGDCERTLGRWIHERGLREQVVIVDKGAHPNADRDRVTPFDITSDLHDSLARLKTDYIDIYFLHRDDPSKPVGPLVEILNEHWQAGRIRAFGGSNWSPERILEATAYAEAHGLQPFVISSPNFSLAVQMQAPWVGCLTIGGAAGAAARQWYSRTRMPLLTWSSLAGGFFSGRFQRDNLDSLTNGVEPITARTYGVETNFQRLERAQALGRKKGATAAQIALAYLLNQPLNLFALVGCQTAAEFAENAAAVELALTPDELSWLESGSPGDRTGADAVPMLYST